MKPRHCSMPSDKNLQFRIGILGVLALALFLRIPGVTYGLPYISYIDEGHLLHPVMRMLAAGTWDPGWYRYPSFLMQLIAVVALVLDKALVFTGFDSLVAGIPAGHEAYYDLIGPQELVVIARLIVLAHALGVVLLCAQSSRLLAGGGGVFAGLLAAVTPALVSRSDYVAVDMVVSFYFLLALYSAARIVLTCSSKGVLLLGGAAAGISFTTKYQAGVAVVAVGLAALLQPGKSMVRRMGEALLVGASFCVAAVVAMPALVLRNQGVMASITGQWEVYARKSSSASYFTRACFASELGYLWLFLAVVASAVFLFHSRTRRVALCWVPALLPMILLPHNFAYQPFRNMLPVVVALVALIGVLPILCTSFLRLRPLRYLPLILMTATGLFFFQRSSAIYFFHEPVADTRVTVVDWLEKNIASQQTVFVERGLVFLPQETARLSTRVNLLPERVGELEELVSGPGVYVVGKKIHSLMKQSGEYSELFATGSKSIPDVPNFWRTNRLFIAVMRSTNSGDI